MFDGRYCACELACTAWHIGMSGDHRGYLSMVPSVCRCFVLYDPRDIGLACHRTNLLKHVQGYYLHVTGEDQA